ADVRGGRRSRPLRRRHGHFYSQSGGVLEAVFRSGRGHRSATGRRHPRDRRATRARSGVRRRTPGPAAVELADALSARNQRPLGDDAPPRPPPPPPPPPSPQPPPL